MMAAMNTSIEQSGAEDGCGFTGTKLAAAIARQVHNPDPFVTWIRGDSRLDLSGKTLCTWVAKTVTLMTDEGIGRGNRVALDVVTQHPGHWIAPIWFMSSWWAGWHVLLGAEPDDDPVDALVTGPGQDLAPCHRTSAAQVPASTLVQCSLKPWGGPCDELAPAAIDHADCMAMPDALPPADADSHVVLGTATQLPGDDESNIHVTAPITDRVLLAHPTDAQVAWVTARCLVGGGSLVLIDSVEDDTASTDPTCHDTAVREHTRVITR